MARSLRICRCSVVSAALLFGCGEDGGAPSVHSSEPAVAQVDEDAAPKLDNRAFPLLVWSSWLIERDYFDRHRIDPKAQLLAAVDFIGLQTPEFFAAPAADGRLLVVTVRSAQAQFSLDGLDTLRVATDRLEEILEFTQSVLDLEPDRKHELEYLAINGLFSPLDPHTILLTPEEHTDLGIRTKGEFGGIGAEIRAEDRRIRIVRVVAGGPAAKAGLLAGDLVLNIDRESTVNMTSSEAQQRLRGPIGEMVVVKVQRAKKLLTLPIVRDVIKVPSVHDARLPGDVGYIRITNFQEDTSGHVAGVLESLASSRALRALVLDVRGNSGGLLTQATGVLDRLVTAGELVIVRSANEREVDSATADASLSAEVPVVVLVDEESASAAEIVSGGIKALGRGIVLGRSTFGKGTVQMLKPATPYGRELAMKLTVAEYLVAGDERIQSVGVMPDLQLHPVELSDIPGVARFYDEERFERMRERSRTAHLPSSSHEYKGEGMQKPAAALRYLWSADVPAADWQGLAAPPEELRDPEIRLARAVALELVGKSSRSEQLAALEAISTRLGKVEDRRIVDALRSRHGIDYSGVLGRNYDPELHIQARLAADGAVTAGEPFVLEVAVENRGKEAAERVHLVTDCAHDELDGIELLIGTIAAGATVERQLRLQVMPWRGNFTDALTLQVHAGEPDERPDAETRVMIDVSSLLAPAFSFDYWIVDDPHLAAVAPRRAVRELLGGENEFSVAGNGDGLLQPGERVLLAVVARNHGRGVAHQARAVLRNLAGRQGLLEEGTVELGRIAPDHEGSGAFGISVAPDADPSLPFELELMVGDVRLQRSVRDKLRLRVFTDVLQLDRRPTAARVGAEPARLYNGAHASAAMVGRLPAETVVRIAGRAGTWAYVEAGLVGRRLFLPADVLDWAPANVPARAITPKEHHPVVVPPTVEVDATPRTTAEPKIRVSGRVVHPVRVRDVMIAVLPPGTAQLERKIYYLAHRERSVEPPSTLAFATDVPLEPGGNRITILARDGAGVAIEHELWVYRE